MTERSGALQDECDKWALLLTMHRLPAAEVARAFPGEPAFERLKRLYPERLCEKSLRRCLAQGAAVRPLADLQAWVEERLRSGAGL